MKEMLGYAEGSQAAELRVAASTVNVPAVS